MYPFIYTLQKNISFFIIVSLLLFTLKYIRIALLRPDVWFAIAMATYCICTGGIVYAVIHGVPWFKFERNEYGSVYVSEYFMKGQRGQWAGEGYIVSTLMAITGGILILLSKADTILTKSTNKRIFIMGACLGVFFLNQLILMCYRFKSPWYGPTFMPPGHY
jgi:hypothetical protein